MMSKTLHAIKIALLLPVALAIFLLALPFALLSGIISAVMRPHRRKVLRQDLEDLWLPERKYMYLFYDPESPLADFIQTKLLPAYGANMVVGTPPSHLKGSPFRRVAEILFVDYIQDYDGDFDAALATISNHRKLSVHEPVFETTTGEIQMEETQDRFMNAASKCLHEWQHAPAGDDLPRNTE